MFDRRVLMKNGWKTFIVGKQGKGIYFIDDPERGLVRKFSPSETEWFLESILELFEEDINAIQNKIIENKIKEKELQNKREEDLLWTLASKFGYNLEKKKD